MLTFEQFISEAIDDIGVKGRVKSGQLNPKQAEILQQRQNARAKLPSTPPQNITTAPMKPISGVGVKGLLPGTSSGYKPQPVIKPNNDLGTPEKRKPIPADRALAIAKKPDPNQEQRNRILKKHPIKLNVPNPRIPNLDIKKNLRKSIVPDKVEVSKDKGEQQQGGRKYGVAIR